MAVDTGIMPLYLYCLNQFGFVFTPPRDSTGNLGGMVQKHGSDTESFD